MLRRNIATPSRAEPLPEAVHIVVAAITMFVGAIVVGTLGFGLGITTTPVLLLVLDPQTVVVVAVSVGVGVFAIVFAQSRRSVPAKEMVPIGLAGLLGAILGVFVLNSASSSALRIGITLLVLVTATAVSLNLGRSRFLGPPLGFVAGALISASGIGGPLLVVYLLNRGWSAQVMRASLSLYFLIVMGTGGVGYGVSGLFTTERLALILFVGVPVLLGFWLSGTLRRRLSERSLPVIVLAVIMSTSVMVLVRELRRI